MLVSWFWSIEYLLDINLVLFYLKTENEKSDHSGRASQIDSSDESTSSINLRNERTLKSPSKSGTRSPSKSGSKTPESKAVKSPSVSKFDTKGSSKTISNESLYKKSGESTPAKADKINEKDLTCTRDNEINKSDYFNGIKQEEFNRACEIDDIEFVPHFQRVYISGDDNSGVNKSQLTKYDLIWFNF